MKHNFLKKVLLYAGTAGLFLTVALSGCKKFEDPPPYFEDYGLDTTIQPKRKVMLIVVDGVPGTEIKKDIPPNITAMMANAKYTWEGLSDENVSNGATWSSILRGVSSSNHRITDSSFIPAEDPNDPHGEIAYYPTFFSRILEVRPLLYTVTITPWEQLSTYSLVHAEKRIVAANDVAAKDSAINALANKKTDLLLVNFNEVEVAGQQYGYSMSVPQYKDALTRVDGYIGELMAAMKARPDYNDKEDWLVMVVSNHGGNTGSVVEQRNIFGVYYNKNFSSLELLPSIVDVAKIYGNGSTGGDIPGRRAVTGSGAPVDMFNVRENESRTIEFKIKVNPAAAGGFGYSNPYIIGKCKDRYYDKGWMFFETSNGNLMFYARAGNSSTPKIEIGVKAADGYWHTVTTTITNNGGTSFTANVYVDGGAKVTQTTALGSNSIDNTLPLRLGYDIAAPDPFGKGAGDLGYPNYYMADIKIYNKALSDNVINDYQCLRDPSKHPDYANLIGYWPAIDGSGNNMVNKAVGAVATTNLTFEGVPVTWEKIFGNIPCSYASENPDAAILTQNIDVFPNIFYWLKIPVISDWKLNASNWISTYEYEFLK